MYDLFRQKETGELFNHHELLSYSWRSNGPNFDPLVVTTEIMELLNVEFVITVNHEQALNKYEYYDGIQVVQENGLWYRKQVISEYTSAEDRNKVDQKIRDAALQTRNFLLSETDWTQLVDVPETTKAQYATYRQQLRDITSVVGFPDNFEWPTKPE
jgi:hypothetical protein